jgi:translation elongation factor EF-1alpha
MTNAKKKLSLTAVGQPGCGKSTLIGHVVCALGDVDPEKIKATEARAAAKDKRSARYAMVRALFLPIRYKVATFKVC